MKEFNEWIGFCDVQYKNSDACNCGEECKYNHQCDFKCSMKCYKCIKKVNSFYNTADHYKCEKMTYNYCIKYGYRFYAEVCLLVHNYYNPEQINNDIYIASIGCGPCTELYGMLQTWRFHGGKDEKFHFRGFDKNEIWKPIMDFNNRNFVHMDVHADVADIFDYYNNHEEPLDVIVLNYSLSDMYRFNYDWFNTFLNELSILVCNKNVSCVLTNDIYSIQSMESAKKLIVYLAKQGLTSVLGYEKFNYSGKYNLGYWGKNVFCNSFPTIDNKIKQDYDPFSRIDSIQTIISCNHDSQR